MSKHNVWLTTTLMLSLPLVCAAAGGGKLNNPASEDAREKLRNVQVSAGVVADEADKLSTLITNVELDPEAHGSYLDLMRNRVNKMAAEVRSLDAEGEALMPWEREALGRAAPLLVDSAKVLENAIQSFNANRSHLWADPEYRSDLDRLHSDSARLASTLRAYFDLAKARSEQQRLNESTAFAGGVQ